MRIFDATKTYELNEKSLDFEKGYLKDDKKFVRHYEAAPFVKGKTAQQIAQELELQGVIIEKGYGAMLYRVVKEEESGGRETELIEDEPDIPAQEAYDEYEDIQVYVPYNAEELKNMLRAKRIPLLNAFDKWEKAVLRGREVEDGTIMSWYYALLNLQEMAFDIVPERIEYYL